MPNFRNGYKFCVSGGLFVILGFLVLLVPLQWLFAVIVSAVIHELCHVAVIRLWNLRILSVCVSIRGAQIRTEPMTYTQELTCALAGPVGGIMLLLFARWFPRVALCAAFHSLYNLLPIYPSDGARILRCGAKLLLPENTAEILCSVIETGFLVCVTLLGIYGSFVLGLGFYPVMIAFILTAKKLRFKNPLQTMVTQGTIDAL